MCFSIKWNRPLLFVPPYKLGYSIVYRVPDYIYYHTLMIELLYDWISMTIYYYHCTFLKYMSDWSANIRSNITFLYCWITSIFRIIIEKKVDLGIDKITNACSTQNYGQSHLLNTVKKCHHSLIKSEIKHNNNF